MSKPDPKRILEARRAALRNRLIGDDHLLPEQADRLISDWAQATGEPQSPEEFDAAYEWIVGEIDGRHQ